MPVSIAESAIKGKQEIAFCAYPGRRCRANTHYMTLTNAKIGAVIDRYRIKSGLTKKELSDETGIDAANLNRIISGKQGATLDRLSALAAFFNVSVSQIIKEAEGPTGDQRKAILHELIDALPEDQIDQAFRRWPVQAAKPGKKSGTI